MAESPRATLSSDHFKYWIVDRKSDEVRVIMQDGRDLRMPLGDDARTISSEISVSTFDWDKWWVENITKRGHLVVAEAYSPVTPDPTYGRKVVYLDQNHWSTVAAALTSPERVADEIELAAALDLAHLAHDGGVLVPLSAAHLRETSALYGDRRYEVGIAMASLSGGWQWRHPLQVWRNEMTRTFADELGLAAPSSALLPVVTLEPQALLDMDEQPPIHAMALDDTELFLRVLGAPSVLLELLVDPEADERVSNQQWVARQVELAGVIASSAFNREQKRAAAYAMLWRDNTEPVHRALGELGVDISALDHLRGGDIPRIFGASPMLSFFSQLMSQRLIDATNQWRPNDLTDVMFLATGTGYADYVVAERHTGTQLQQAQRSRRLPSTVYTKLSEAVQAIRSDGVVGRGERDSSGVATPS